MKITSLEEYGVRCMLRVAKEAGGTPVSAQYISESEGISIPYTQKILRILVKYKLIEATRGAHGGYSLARPVEEISLGDVMRALGGVIETESICERHTGEESVCRNAQNCAIRPVWSYVSAFIVETFDMIPLKLLLEEENKVAQTLSKLSVSNTDLMSSYERDF